MERRPGETTKTADVPETGGPEGITRPVAGGLGFRLFKDRAFGAVVFLLSLLVSLPLFFILYYIFRRGAAAVTWDFLVRLPRPVGEVGGGISNAIVGTLILIAIALLVSGPLGVSVGIYLSESRGKGPAGWVRLGAEVLQGIPSIVIGIMAYLWVVRPMGTFSALSGGIALGIMMLPFVARSTEETLKRVPADIREASLALGVPYYRTVLRVIVPAGMSGIVTGLLVGVARIAGETAPLLFTAFGNPFMSLNIFKPIHSMPLLIFNYAVSPYEEWHTLAWGASVVLIALVLLLNLVSRIVVQRWKTRY